MSNDADHDLLQYMRVMHDEIMRRLDKINGTVAENEDKVGDMQITVATLSTIVTALQIAMTTLTDKRETQLGRWIGLGLGVLGGIIVAVLLRGLLGG